MHALRHLIVHRSSEFEIVTTADALKDEWTAVRSALKHRANVGLPVTILTLSGCVDFSDHEDTIPQALTEVDAESCLLLAAPVDKVVDKLVWRAGEQRYETPGVKPRRLLDYCREDM